MPDSIALPFGSRDIMSLWHSIDSGAGAPAFNMALDEALLRDAVRRGCPALRFYSWTIPAATFGLSQDYAAVSEWTLLRPLIRRPTGGGVVPHLNDWTYSVALPAGDPWHALRAADSYIRLHRWLQAAFLELGLEAELCPERIPDAPGQCFIGAEQHDLLCRGRKIAGAAQRRTRQGMLIQGSVQPPPPRISRVDWQSAMRRTAGRLWGAQWEIAEPGPAAQNEALRLEQGKYGQDAHNRSRRQAAGDRQSHQEQGPI
jgi:lipoate-protein ligase A